MYYISIVLGVNMKTVTIQTRVDERLKTEAESLFASIGIDMTSAIRLFLTQAVNQRKIPFIPVAPEEKFNNETLTAMQESLDILNGKIKTKTYDSFSEALKDIDNVAEQTPEYKA